MWQSSAHAFSTISTIGYWILAILAQYWLLAMLYWELKFDEKTACKPVVYTCNTSIHISSTKHFTCWRDTHPVVTCISNILALFLKICTSWQHKHNCRFVTQKTGILDVWVRHPYSPYIFACFSYCPSIASAWVHFPVQKTTRVLPPADSRPLAPQCGQMNMAQLIILTYRQLVW